MSLNISSGVNYYNRSFTSRSSNKKKETTNKYDLTKMGTIRDAVIQERAKEASKNKNVSANGEPLRDKIVTWHGIDITDTPHIFKEIVPITDEAKQKCYEVVKKSYEETARVAFDDVSNIEDFHSYCKNAVKDIEGMDKLKTHWSISQYFSEMHKQVEAKVRELDPKWDWGQPVKTEVLGQIFGTPLDITV